MTLDTSPFETTDDPSRSTRRVLLASAAVFMLLIGGVVGYWIWQSYAMATERARDMAESFTLTYTAFTEQVLANISGTLVEIASLRDAGGDMPLVGDLQAFMALRKEQTPFVRDLLVLDAQGQPVSWTGAGSAPDMMQIPGVRAQFQQGREANWISPVFRDRYAGGAFTFLVVHETLDAAERMSGAVIALVDQAQFASAFGMILQAGQASVALVHFDGTVMARLPDVPGAVGQRIAKVAARSPRGPVVRPRVIVSPLDGVKRFITERRTTGYPLIAAVTVTMDAALAPWRRGVGWALGVLVLAGLGVAGLTYGLMRQVRLQAAAQLAQQRQNTVLVAQQETSTDGILVVDSLGRVLSWNRRFVDLWGVSTSVLESERRETLLEAIYPKVEDSFGFERRIEDLHARPDEEEVDGTEVRLRDGRILERYSRVLRNAHGVIWGRVWFYRDITQRRRGEQALQESEQRFRDVANAADEFIWEVDKEGNLTFVTDRATDFLGYQVGEMLGKSPLDFIHPDDRAWVTNLVHDALGHEEGYAIADYRMISRSGDIIWLRTNAVPIWDEHGRLRGYRGASMNNNDVKTRELDMQDANRRLEDQAAALVALAEQLDTSNQEIRRVQERFDLAMRGTTDGIYDWDLVTNRIYLSPRWSDMLGLGQDEADVDPPFWTVRIHPDDYLGSVRAMSEHLHGKSRQYRHAHRMRHQDGGYLWVLDRARAVRDENGQPVRLVGTHVDITEMRRYEEALHQAKIEAEHANAAKSRFLAVMSHEIRTPMTGVLGMTDLLLSSGLDDSQKSFALTVKRSAETLLGLLNDILDFSKIEAGQLVLEDMDFDIGAAVEDVVDLLRINASEKGLTLSVQNAVLPPAAVRGDPHRLRQVLFNLVGNAIKFTQKGEVVVSLEQFENLTDVYDLRFAVRDTGIGLSDDQRSRLFQPFIQADNSTTRRFGGTGLGLVICQRLIEAMGGEISVESTLGKGSTFRFSVQVRPGDPARVPKPLASPLEDDGTGEHRRPSPGTRLLLAEDTPANRLLIATMLERMGFEVDQVTDGEEAFHAVAADPYRFALVLMDMQMPIMDGVTATRAIETLPDPPPVVGLTADAMRENHGAYLAAGLKAVLTKPVDWGRLQQTLITYARGVTWLTSEEGDDESRETEAGDNEAGATKAGGNGDDPVRAPGPQPDGTDQTGAQPDLTRAGESEEPEAVGEEVGEPDVAGGRPEDPQETDSVNNPPPLFNSASLDTLNHRLGADRILPIVRSMVDNMDVQIRALSDAVRAADDDGIRRIGHTLKGLAGQFGASRLSWLGERLQRDTVGGAGLSALAAEAEAVAAETRVAVNAWVQRLSTEMGHDPSD